METDHEHELEEFCRRWKKDVFTFCWALLGDAAAAEEAACEAFARLRREPAARMNDLEAVSRLLGSAFRVTEKYRNGSSSSSRVTSRLEDATQRLPRLERAVVIMRNLLHMEWVPLARVVDLSPSEAHQAWVRGVFQLNEFLQRSATKERR